MLHIVIYLPKKKNGWDKSDPKNSLIWPDNYGKLKAKKYNTVTKAKKNMAHVSVILTIVGSESIEYAFPIILNK